MINGSRGALFALIGVLLALVAWWAVRAADRIDTLYTLVRALEVRMAVIEAKVTHDGR